MSGKDKLIGNLKAHREALGWSVKEVGDRTGLDETVIAQWERGDASPQLEEAANWASALGLTLALTPAGDEARRWLYVDWEARRTSVDGAPVRLTLMEWKALERLAAAPGELVPHIDLFRHLYGENEPYRVQSTSIRVLITKLRRLLPPLRIETQRGRGYVISGIASSSPRGTPQAEVAAERHAEPAPPQPDKPRNSVALTPRADELMSIERFVTERGVTRCPDMATIQHAPLPSLIWDKKKRRWVRPPTVMR